jgi:hypothetical protein
MKILTTTLLVSLSLLGGAACAATSDSATGAPTHAAAQTQSTQSQAPAPAPHSGRLNSIILDGGQYYPYIYTPSTFTRDEVRQQLAAAEAAGQVTEFDDQYPRMHSTSTETRAEVRDDLIKYQATHPNDFVSD